MLSRCLLFGLLIILTSSQFEGFEGYKAALDVDINDPVELRGNKVLVTNSMEYIISKSGVLTRSDPNGTIGSIVSDSLPSSR